MPLYCHRLENKLNNLEEGAMQLFAEHTVCRAKCVRELRNFGYVSFVLQQACPEGSYSLRGESACRPCPAGFACTVRKDHMVNTFRDKPTAVGLNARSGEGNAREDSEIARSPSNFVEQSIVELLLPCKAGYFSGEVGQIFGMLAE